MEKLILATGFLLLIIGLWGILTNRNMLRIIVGFSLFDTGIHVIMLATGFLRGKTAPIISDGVTAANIAEKAVDPVPQALVLTAIVIGLGVTALMLSYAVKLYESRKTLEIDKFEDLKW